VSGFGIACVAALCMICQDVVAVVLVQAEAANRGWLAGLADLIGWYVGIATTTISVTSLQGHSVSKKIWVLTLVGLANVVGTKLGQMTGKRILGAMEAKEKLEIHAASRK
jgi:hypothetical protein